MRKVVGTGLPKGGGVEVFHSTAGSSKKLLPINKEGLVLYMSADSAYSNMVFDVSEKLNHGTRYGAFVTNNGKVGKGLQFDGIDDYVDCGNDASLEPGTGAYTISYWVNPIAPDDYVMRKGGQVGVGGWKIYFDGSRRMRIYLRSSTEENIHTINSYLTLSAWSMVTFTWDGANTIKGYHNGVYIDESVSAVGDITVGLDFEIGRAANYFEGKIDEVKFYNRELSPEEILADYQREV